jgi:hypothetical protein
MSSVQIIQDQGEAKFAVIDFQEFTFIKEILNDYDKLQDYLDYLHMQKIKQQETSCHSLEEVKMRLSELTNQ